MTDRLETWHEFDHGGKHYRLVIDQDYEPGLSGDPEHEQEDYQEELDAIMSGEYVALGCIVSEPCRGLVDEKGEKRVAIVESHCECCSGRRETDSLWGIVVENDHEAAERFCREERGR